MFELLHAANVAALIDLEELAVRLMAARIGLPRPVDCSAGEIMGCLPEGQRAWMLRQAQAAADYIIMECLRAQPLH